MKISADEQTISSELKKLQAQHHTALDGKELQIMMDYHPTELFESIVRRNRTDPAVFLFANLIKQNELIDTLEENSKSNKRLSKQSQCIAWCIVVIGSLSLITQWLKVV